MKNEIFVCPVCGRKFVTNECHIKNKNPLTLYCPRCDSLLIKTDNNTFTELVEKFDIHLNEKLETGTPYMVRHNGEILKCGSVHPYVKAVWDTVDNTLYNINFNTLKWFLLNTENNRTKELLLSIIKYIITNKLNNRQIFEEMNLDLDNVYCPDKEEIVDFVEQVNNDTNQEFLRMRTSNLYYGGNSKDIYFRISSVGYNWFPVIWNILNDNENYLSLTVCKDSNTFGGGFDWYKINGVALNHIDRNTFLTLKGNPIIEKYQSKFDCINEAVKLLEKGRTVSQAYYYLHPRYGNGFYKTQIKECLEYDMNNILQK